MPAQQVDMKVMIANAERMRANAQRVESFLYKIVDAPPEKWGDMITMAENALHILEVRVNAVPSYGYPLWVQMAFASAGNAATHAKSDIQSLNIILNRADVTEVSQRQQMRQAITKTTGDARSLLTQCAQKLTPVATFRPRPTKF